ncbi:MAG: hypothetical protein KF764_08520 [Labilithrix sp.]|nr:hypothetical protein [Labilithrix sp.]
MAEYVSGAADVLIGLAMVIFVGWAVSRHVDWQDAVASVFVLMLLLRALRRRGAA